MSFISISYGIEALEYLIKKRVIENHDKRKKMMRILIS